MEAAEEEAHPVGMLLSLCYEGETVDASHCTESVWLVLQEIMYRKASSSVLLSVVFWDLQSKEVHCDGTYQHVVMFRDRR